MFRFLSPDRKATAADKAHQMSDLGLRRGLFSLAFLGLSVCPLWSVPVEQALPQSDAGPDYPAEVRTYQAIPRPAAPIKTAKPLSDRGLYWNGQTEFYLGMNLVELEKTLGPWPDLKKDWAIFSNGLTVMLRDDKVIHLSCTPATQTHDLALGSSFRLWGMGLGDSQSSIKNKLGSPTRVLRRPDGALVCWVYKRSTQADLGYIIGSGGRIEAMLMVERDKLEGILITRGYTVL